MPREHDVPKQSFQCYVFNVEKKGKLKVITFPSVDLKKVKVITYKVLLNLAKRGEQLMM